MANKIHISENSEPVKKIWNEYVQIHPHSRVYHLFEWKNVIEKSFGHQVYNFYSSDATGLVNGLLPVVHINSKLFGNYAVSLPYFNHGGALADSLEIENELISQAVNFVKNLKINSFEMRTSEQKNLGLPVKTSKVCMYLDLPSDAETLFKSFPAKLRSQIRRPEKEGMIFKNGHLDLLDDYYRIFSENMRDLGTPVYSKSFFVNILESFPDSAHLGVVYAGDTPVAAGFVIGHKQMMEIPWASSRRAYNRFSPNMFLYWNLLKLAIEKGYTCFDFGRSSEGEGTHKFKLQWGTRQEQLYWYYWLPAGKKLPELNPDNPKYKLAISVWQKLPLWLTERIGPSIVKNLP